MRAGAAGAATVRHVGLVALESLLVAVLVWIAAMTLAGANQSTGLVGIAEAGRDPSTVTVRPAILGQNAVVTASRAPDGGWVHLSCLQGTKPVLTRWARLDKQDRATVRLGPTSAWTSGSAACTAEIGYFSANGRWRVEASSTFTATGS